jgi:hypothetical protein
MSISLESDFKIVRYSDLKYERMTVEIEYKDEPIAQINQDKGVEFLEVEIYTDYVEKVQLKFLLSDFLEALEMAKRLITDNEYA